MGTRCSLKHISYSTVIDVSNQTCIISFQYVALRPKHRIVSTHEPAWLIALRYGAVGLEHRIFLARLRTAGGPQDAGGMGTMTDDLRRRRLRLGLTQKQLGMSLGVSGNTIHRWENGLVKMPRTAALLLERIEADAAGTGGPTRGAARQPHRPGGGAGDRAAHAAGGRGRDRGADRAPHLRRAPGRRHPGAAARPSGEASRRSVPAGIETTR